MVSWHYCSGSASNAHGWFQGLADQHGFLIIAPQAGGNCFDATPARSGEREAITKMVEYVIAQNNADPTRVFAAGASSGGCMTNALLAAYPDVFAGGSVLAGVPAGAWTGGNAYGWSTPANRTAAQWGDIVRNAHPGFTGARPRVQLWHGTADDILTYNQAFPAEVAQWTNVFGVTDADGTKSTFNSSRNTWSRTSYKNSAGVVVLETNVAQGAPRDLTGLSLWACGTTSCASSGSNRARRDVVQARTKAVLARAARTEALRSAAPSMCTWTGRGAAMRAALRAISWGTVASPVLRLRAAAARAALRASADQGPFRRLAIGPLVRRPK